MKIDKSIKIVIEDGVPYKGRGIISEKLRAAFRTMKPGQSFLWPEHTTPYRLASEVGAVIKTQKQNGTGYRIWLVKRPHDLPPKQRIP